MGKQRKTWTIEQKLTLILAALRDEHSVAGLARQYGVSEQQIYRWKAQFLEGGRHRRWVGRSPLGPINGSRAKTSSSRSSWARRPWRSTS